MGVDLAQAVNTHEGAESGERRRSRWGRHPGVTNPDRVGRRRQPAAMGIPWPEDKYRAGHQERGQHSGKNDMARQAHASSPFQRRINRNARMGQ
jgi:hypothetical protein